MKLKRHISIFLLLLGTILIVMPAIPHHHHGNGVICMKDDVKTDGCCPTDQSHHHQDDDPCCTDSCTARFLSSTPVVDTDNIQPQFICLDILFTHSLIRFLTEPIEQEYRPGFVYLESLHGTHIARAAGLRAPPFAG